MGEEDDHPSTPEPKAVMMTPSTAMTNETAGTPGTTWYSYYSQENDREYFHEPVSGITSWVAPTVGPSGSPVLRRGGVEDEDEDDSHHSPLACTEPNMEPLMKDPVAPPRSLQVKLAYWGMTLLASNLLIMCWTRYSLQNVSSGQLADNPTLVSIECEPCPEEPLIVEEQEPPVTLCEPVACEPVACQPVACSPVPCEPTPCEPVACDPCPPQTVCDPPVVEYRCLPQSRAYDFAGNYEKQKFVQRLVQDNVKALDQVLQHVDAAALPAVEDEASTLSLIPPTLGQDLFPKVCRIPLAKRVVPECRDRTVESSSTPTTSPE